LLYDGEIRCNDFYFQKFIDKLNEFLILKDTLFIITSDHGEHLGEHGMWEHCPPGYIQVLKVPLIMVYSKKIPPNFKIHQNVQLIDIMPTILDFADIDRREFTNPR
jgi:arylsulfatase A-like enzyme